MSWLGGGGGDGPAVRGGGARRETAPEGEGGRRRCQEGVGQGGRNKRIHGKERKKWIWGKKGNEGGAVDGSAGLGG